MDRNKILWHLKGDRKDDQTLQDRDTIVTRRQRNRILQTVEKQVNNMRREFWRQTKGRRRLNSPQFDVNPRHSRFLPMLRGKDQHRDDTTIVFKNVKIMQLQNIQNGQAPQQRLQSFRSTDSVADCNLRMQRSSREEYQLIQNNFIKLMAGHACNVPVKSKLKHPPPGNPPGI